MLLIDAMHVCLISFFLSSFIYPVTAHLIWARTGLLSASSKKDILGTDGVLDNAGSMVVHVTGGATALVGAWMVGPRIGRFDIEGNPVRMQSHSMVRSHIHECVWVQGSSRLEVKGCLSSNLF